MRIGCDVDGVIADFNAEFMDLTVRVTGEDRYGLPRPPITAWNYNTDQFGYTKEQDRAAWKAVRESANFWYSLDSYEPAGLVIDELVRLQSLGHEVYFITSRLGDRPKAQTEMWLEDVGFSNPTVLISSAKGLCAEALQLDLYIDDKIENVQDVRDHRKQCRTFILTQPWNTAVTPFGSERLDTLEQFFTILQEIV